MSIYNIKFKIKYTYLVLLNKIFFKIYGGRVKCDNILKSKTLSSFNRENNKKIYAKLNFQIIFKILKWILF